MKIEEIEKDLNTLRKIKFNKRAETNNKFGSFKDVIDLAVKGESTVMEHGKGYQCGPNRSRGLADLYRLVKYYYPKTTLKDIIKYTKEQTTICNQLCYETNQHVYFQNMGGVTYRHYQEPTVRLSNRKKVEIEN